MQRQNSHSKRSSLGHASSKSLGRSHNLATVSGLTNLASTNPVGPFSTTPSLPYRPSLNTVVAHHHALAARDERRMLDHDDEDSLGTPPASYKTPPQLEEDYVPGPRGVVSVGDQSKMGDLKALARNKSKGLRIDTAVENMATHAQRTARGSEGEDDGDSVFTASPTASFLADLLPEPEHWSPTMTEWIQAGAKPMVPVKPVPSGSKASKSAPKFLQALGKDGDEISVLMKTPKPSVQNLKPQTLKPREEYERSSPPDFFTFEWPEGRRNSINYRNARMLRLPIEDLRPIRREPEDVSKSETLVMSTEMQPAASNAQTKGKRCVVKSTLGSKALREVKTASAIPEDKATVVPMPTMPAVGKKQRKGLKPNPSTSEPSLLTLPDDYKIGSRETTVTNLNKSDLQTLKQQIQAAEDREMLMATGFGKYLDKTQPGDNTQKHARREAGKDAKALLRAAKREESTVGCASGMLEKMHLRKHSTSVRPKSQGFSMAEDKYAERPRRQIEDNRTSIGRDVADDAYGQLRHSRRDWK